MGAKRGAPKFGAPLFMELLVAIESYRDLRVWQTGMELVTDIYRLTESFPTYEKFGLTAQLRRAAISIVSNIAEGHGRSTRGEYLQQISTARGSAIEVEVQLLVAERLEYTDAEALAVARERCESICRMSTQLKRALARKRPAAS
jgi:four helix bundle protein